MSDWTKVSLNDMKARAEKARAAVNSSPPSAPFHAPSPPRHLLRGGPSGFFFLSGFFFRMFDFGAILADPTPRDFRGGSVLAHARARFPKTFVYANIWLPAHGSSWP